jgi:hypothetical protein
MASDRSQARTADITPLAVALERLAVAVARLEAALVAHDSRSRADCDVVVPAAGYETATDPDAELLRTLASRVDAAIARLRVVLAE